MTKIGASGRFPTPKKPKSYVSKSPLAVSRSGVVASFVLRESVTPLHLPPAIASLRIFNNIESITGSRWATERTSVKHQHSGKMTEAVRLYLGVQGISRASVNATHANVE